MNIEIKEGLGFNIEILQMAQGRNIAAWRGVDRNNIRLKEGALKRARVSMYRKRARVTCQLFRARGWGRGPISLFDELA
jgi:hypothetical protein